MLKVTRRCISILLLAMLLLPTTAFAAPASKQSIMTSNPIDESTKIIGIPVGEAQTLYPIRPYSSGSFPGQIISLWTRPTRNGNIVYPNLEIQIMGAAVVTAYVELQQYSNGKWNSLWTSSGQNYVDRIFKYNPGREANGSGTYRFVFTITTNGGGVDRYHGAGDPFSL